jgi:predicted RNase H-like HicB family nuclease
MSYIFSAIIHKEDDIFVANCPEIGTVSQGYNIDEAVANLREATLLYLEEFPIKENVHPLITTFEVPINAETASYVQ